LAGAAAVLPVITIAGFEIVLGAAIVAMIAMRVKPRWPAIWLPISLFFLGTVISWLASGDLRGGLPQIKKFYVYAMVFVVAGTFRNIAQIRWLALAWAVAASASAGLGLYQSGAPSANSEILASSNFGGKGPAATGAHRGMSPFGTYDMAGNVSEWAVNADGGRRYLLGGSWDEDPGIFLAPRAEDPMARAATFGFRCVQRVTPASQGSLDAFSFQVLQGTPVRSKPLDDRTFKIFADLQAYDKTDLAAKVEQIADSSPYWRRETITFPAAYGGERMMVHLFLPKNSAPPYQVVTVVGAVTIFDAKRVQDFQFPYEFFLRSGRAVVIPVLSGTLERGPSPPFPPFNQERERALRWPKDMGQTIDYLETRRDIDTQKLGYYGTSTGAMHGVRLIALEHRFKAAALTSAGLMGGQPQETDAWNYAPRVHIPVLMLNGRDDFLFPVETVQKPLFNALGTPASDKRYVQFDGGHVNLFSRPDLIGEILEWFDHYLGPVKLRP
jgi:hypothetical protein